MPASDVLLRTKLTPPGLHRRLLSRPALTARLREALDYRLTLVQAGTGYGKSTALAALAGGDAPASLAWYSVDEADIDPQRFLSYLIAAFKTRLPHLSEAPTVALHEISGEGGPDASARVVDTLINALAEVLSGPYLLVVDDVHFVAGSPEIDALLERFVAYLPSSLHVILAARHPINWPSLVTWRAKGEVLDIDGSALAFQPDEIEALFRNTYGMALTPDEIAVLADKTEGWPIALQLVWQGLRNRSAQSVADLLVAAQGPSSLGTLFDYLARDVLARQPPDIAAFLRDTAILRELTPAACDAVMGLPISGAMLDQLHDLHLFVVALGERHYRYHHLFHDFLRSVSKDTSRTTELQRRAAAFFHASGKPDEAIYHWLAAQEFAEAALDMERAGQAALQNGQLDTLATWIDSLPAPTLADRPLLQAYLGDVYRLRSRFDEALSWYAQAERTWRARGDPTGISRALRGQALVYLDTVRPSQAESLLEEALRFTDGMADRQARARLLELMAENKLNMGKPVEAESLRSEAQSLRDEGPHEDVLEVRVKIRTGRLDEAQRILEMWAAAERGQAHLPRAHRETVLLLSLIHSMRGNAREAFALAQESIELGQRLNSPFITAVGHMRLGHAWQLLPQPNPPPSDQHDRGGSRDEAIRCYQSAIALGDRLAVRRTRVEAMWGLTRAYGMLGVIDLESAKRAAAEGVETGRWAGDPWVVALVEIALGGSYVLAGQLAQAVDILSSALRAFRDCGDSLGRAAARLWLSLAYLDLKQVEHFTTCVDDLLALCESNQYDFLFTAPTLLGPPDPRRLVSLLIEARDRRCHPTYASRLLAAIGLPEIKVHPGYQLRVQALGEFRVWRGLTEVEPREWQRDKARQLFQLLLTQRGQWLQRDEIVERLWPSLSPEAASRDFKVALNALNRAIEPRRASDAPFAFVIREGSAYRLRPGADVWLDAAVFEHECETGLRLIDGGLADQALPHLQTAIGMYRGDFLPDALYEDWTIDSRERLLSLYLRAADKLAAALIERGRLDDALIVCQSILARDVCWEHAYRLMMTAYARQGNRPQVLRAYQRCVSALRDELGVAPSPATVALYQGHAPTSDTPVTGA